MYDMYEIPEIHLTIVTLSSVLGGHLSNLMTWLNNGGTNIFNAATTNGSCRNK